MELEGRIQHLAYHDPLTGLPNRLFFLERLAQALRKEAQNIAVLYLDLDGLKLVNDLDGLKRGRGAEGHGRPLPGRPPPPGPGGPARGG